MLQASDSSVDYATSGSVQAIDSHLTLQSIKHKAETFRDVLNETDDRTGKTFQVNYIFFCIMWKISVVS